MKPYKNKMKNSDVIWHEHAVTHKERVQLKNQKLNHEGHEEHEDFVLKDQKPNHESGVVETMPRQVRASLKLCRDK